MRELLVQSSEAKSSPLSSAAKFARLGQVTEANQAQMTRAFEKATADADGRDGHFSIRWCLR